MQNEIKEFGKAMYNIAKKEIFPDVEERVKSFKDRVVNDIHFPIKESIKEFKSEIREFTQTPEPHQRKIVVEFIRPEDSYKNRFNN